MEDRFSKMWMQQYEFMQLLVDRRDFPKFPVDLQSKVGQKFLKDITHECQHELFEANQHLKNSKTHRATEIDSFEREAYVEELSDAMHYLFEIAIASGISANEMYNAYMKKGEINTKRILTGY
jgi:hypothetical protein